MKVRQRQERPGRTGRGTRTDFSYDKSSTSRVPSNFREHLCAPQDFYRKHIPGLSLSDSSRIASGTCPLCSDRAGTLRIHVTDPRGHWICSIACGHGDMIAFAQRLLGLDFPNAVRMLMRVRP